ncbi:hypothetical protein [Xanthomonas melonis]|uniref:hypothetical protein n=1 Tax=Xanthomonas melonis TaxID=56456 RepID=UPI001E3CDABA|nr:hypothetical protein [Xanthomonas melonis]MCC4600719.1 hypothetical protein [Xanthomonas melonis]
MNDHNPRTQKYIPILIGGGLLFSAALYFYQPAASVNAHSPVRSERDASIANSTRPTSQRSANQPSDHRLPWDDSDFIAPQGDKPFAASEVQYHLKSFYARFYADPPMSRAERDVFAQRLAIAIDADPNTKRAVADFYGQMPANNQMDRDVMRNMLAISPEGRSILLDEANRIWNSKDKSLYSHMYETYSNLPGQASRNVLANALSSLSDQSMDTRTAVAALNFIGTIEKDDSADAGKLRTNAISQLNSVVSSQAEEVVRGLAAQKIYRLSSPESAADAAVEFIRRDANSSLVMQTLDSINSGDVELTPPLRATLASAVARASATTEERDRFRQVIPSGHS